jgi:hypothetical protein
MNYLLIKYFIKADAICKQAAAFIEFLMLATDAGRQ